MDLTLQPYLENDFVILRPLKLSDFQGLCEVGSDSLIWQQHQSKDRYTLENFKIFFEDAIKSKSALAILDAKDEKLMGSSRFKVIDAFDGGVVEIGWSFLSCAYWGGMYNRAFKKLMVNHSLMSVQNVIF
jgi:RimJ/RimL family protein N-acetyltransferase